MALIMCPECGKDNVSDTAEMCPECGFNIRKYREEVDRAIQKEKELKKEYENIYNSIKIPQEPNKPQKSEIGNNIFCVAAAGFISIAGLLIITMGGLLGILFLVVGIVGVYINLDEIKKKNLNYQEMVALYPQKIEQYEKQIANFDEYKRKRADELFELSQKRKSQVINNAQKDEKYYSDISCPKCGCRTIGVGARGYSIWTGFLGSGKTVNRCGRCGYVWNPKK